MDTRQAAHAPAASVLGSEHLMGRIVQNMPAAALASCALACHKLRGLVTIPLVIRLLEADVAPSLEPTLVLHSATSLELDCSRFHLGQDAACLTLRGFLPQLSGLLTLKTNLRHISDTNICHILHSCACLSVLTHLTLSSANLRSHSSAALAATLPSLPRLVHLGLPRSQLSASSARSLLCAVTLHPGLTALDLGDSFLPPEMDICLELLMLCSQIRHLRLLNFSRSPEQVYELYPEWPEVSSSELSKLWARPWQLTELHVDVIWLGDDGRRLACLQSLCALHVRMYGLESGGAIQELLPTLTALTSLSLPAAVVQYDVTVVSEALASLPTLVHLEVNEELGDEEFLGDERPVYLAGLAPALAALTALTSLHLYISWDEGEEEDEADVVDGALASALVNLTRLLSLELRVAGNSALLAVGTLTSLTELNLTVDASACSSDDELADMLESLLRLQQLSLKWENMHDCGERGNRRDVSNAGVLQALSNSCVSKVELHDFATWNGAQSTLPQQCAPVATLRELTVHQPADKQSCIAALEVLHLLTGLTKLHLMVGGTKCQQAALNALQSGLAELVGLRNLELQGPFPVLMSLKRLTRLTSLCLNISSAELADKSEAQVTLAQSLKRFELLQSYGNRAQPVHDALGTITGLTSLKLQCVRGVLPKALVELHGLKELGLTRVQLQRGGEMCKLQWLSVMTALTSLSICFTAESDGDVACIARALPRMLDLAALDLRLDGVEVSNATKSALSESLQGMTALVHVYLQPQYEANAGVVEAMMERWHGPGFEWGPGAE